MDTPSVMKILAKDHRDAALHTHFMKLAIEQANKSIPIDSGYCVGAVLVQEIHPDPDSDLPQGDRFRVVTTGFSRELDGNTHAEECCLVKLELLKAQEEEKELQLESDVGATEAAEIPIPLSSSSFSSSYSSTSPTAWTWGGNSLNGSSSTNNTANHSSHDSSISSSPTQISFRAPESSAPVPTAPALPGRRNSHYQLRHPHPRHRKEWIVYSTMEPCSKRLSGKRCCADLLIASGVGQVYIGVREPDHFVERAEGVETLLEHGIKVTQIPGLEDECLAPNRHLLQPKVG